MTRSTAVSGLEHIPPTNTNSPLPPLPYMADESLPEVVQPQQPVQQTPQHPHTSMERYRAASYAPAPPTGYRNSGIETVTPLGLLGDQPDIIDCPFCRRRSDTKVTMKSSKWTQ